MAASSHVLFICACVVTLASLCASQGCTNENTPQKCACENDGAVLRCSELDTFPPHDNLGTYQTFIFNNCNFKSIGGDNIPDYPSAKSLMLTRCKIETFEINAFDSLTNLEQLTITANLFKNISKDVLFPPKITHLTMDRNDLTVLPSDVFEQLADLKSIHMNYNKIPYLPENLFSNNPKVTDVELEFNELEEIPKAALLKVNTTLNRLVLSGNQKIGPVQAEMFKEFPNLDYLDLSQCGVNTLDVNTFSGLSKLKTIRLGYNALKELPRDVFKPALKTLKSVWLDNNLLSTLENGTLPLHTLSEVYLGHNPWHCDKKLAWLKDLHLEKIDHENVTCSTPPALAGQLLANVTRDVLNDQPGASGNRRSMIAAAVAIPIIVLCVLAILCIVLRLVQNKRNQKRAQVRYSAVYRDTVETAPKGHHYRPTSNI